MCRGDLSVVTVVILWLALLVGVHLQCDPSDDHRTQLSDAEGSRFIIFNIANEIRVSLLLTGMADDLLLSAVISSQHIYKQVEFHLPYCNSETPLDLRISNPLKDDAMNMLSLRLSCNDHVWTGYLYHGHTFVSERDQVKPCDVPTNIVQTCLLRLEDCDLHCVQGGVFRVTTQQELVE